MVKLSVKRAGQRRAKFTLTNLEAVLEYPQGRNVAKAKGRYAHLYAAAVACSLLGSCNSLYAEIDRSSAVCRNLPENSQLVSGIIESDHGDYLLVDGHVYEQVNDREYEEHVRKSHMEDLFLIRDAFFQRHVESLQRRHVTVVVEPIGACDEKSSANACIYRGPNESAYKIRGWCNIGR